jgi:hypothetical protein
MKLNGIVKIRNRRVPIFWTGQHAQHIAENHIKEGRPLHIEVQQAAQKANFKPTLKSNFVGYFRTCWRFNNYLYTYYE